MAMIFPSSSSSSSGVSDETIVQQLHHVLDKLNLVETDSIVTAKCSHLLTNKDVATASTHPSFVVEEKPIESYIDHTVLKPNATQKDIEQLCHEAIEHHFYAVCVNLCRLDQCVQLLAAQAATTKIAVVVGFPLGATSTRIKVEETREAIAKGAHEIDMVINIGKLLDGDYHYVYNEISALAQECNKHNVLLKCILETSQLPSDVVLVDACLLCLLAGAHFVKTCTGFMGGGATLEHVQLMRRVVGYNNGVQVKASGGVRNYSDAIRLIREGHIDRIGTSSGVSIKSGQLQSQIAERTCSQPDQTSPSNIDFNAAISYVTKVKNRFKDEPSIYKEFLGILHSYQQKHTTVRQVYEHVTAMFKGHADLLDDFVHFLPARPADDQQQQQPDSY